MATTIETKPWLWRKRWPTSSSAPCPLTAQISCSLAFLSNSVTTAKSKAANSRAPLTEASITCASVVAEARALAARYSLPCSTLARSSCTNTRSFSIARSKKWRGARERLFFFARERLARLAVDDQEATRLSTLEQRRSRQPNRCSGRTA
ncbi:MAG: hypothetical protein QM756_28670 [Polyangiaceae bacterium]